MKEHTSSEGKEQLEHDEIVRMAKQNIEQESRNKRLSTREIVFGFNDGSTSTLALLGGVTGGALPHSQILVVGLSAVVAGAISMALGAYISSKSEIDHHQSEIEHEKREIKENLTIEGEEIRQIYLKKADFNEEELNLIVNHITGNEKTCLDFMMKEELGLFKEHFEHPVNEGLVMLLAFLAGGLVPFLPFLLLSSPQPSFLAATILTLTSLFGIGVWETTFTSKYWLKSGLEMVIIGIIAASIPYLIGSFIIPPFISRITH